MIPPRQKEKRGGIKSVVKNIDKSVNNVKNNVVVSQYFLSIQFNFSYVVIVVKRRKKESGQSSQWHKRTKKDQRRGKRGGGEKIKRKESNITWPYAGRYCPF